MQHWRISIVGAALAAAGLPIYIQFPHFANTELGISLGVLGLLLPALRLIDMAQDPILGILAAKKAHAHNLLITLALAGIAVGNVMLFVFPSLSSPMLWSAFWLVVIFSSYSLGIILIYARTTLWAGSEALADQTRVGSFREIGMLLGVIILGVTPTLANFAGFDGGGYSAIGIIVAALAFMAWGLGRPLWRVPANHFAAPTPASWPTALLRNAQLRPMLILGFVNALPVAITSSLFVFFVEDALSLEGLSGPFLILFFLSSGLAIPLWARAVKHYPLRPTLSLAMVLALVSLLWAMALEPQAGIGYGVICVITGAAVGADMVLLPSLFSIILTRTGHDPSQGFGLWSFASKAALVIAVLFVLPILETAGFQSGADNSDNATLTLRLLYAALPAILKILALWLLWRMPAEVFKQTPAPVKNPALAPDQP